MGAFGTTINPAHYVEIVDTATPGQVKRPTAGLVIKVRDHLTGAALADVTTTDYGYWSATYPGVDLIQVSGDGGTTWVGPLQSGSGLEASTQAGGVAAQAASDAAAAVATAQQALTTAQTGPAATWDNITGKPVTFPSSPHTHDRTQVTGTSPTVQNLLGAADATAARTAIGAGTGNGTSNLTLGTTGTTAAPGNHVHDAASVTFSSTVTGLTGVNNVKSAIEQAATLGGGSGGGSEIHPVLYTSGAYEALPAAPLASWRVVEFQGPVVPTPPATSAYAAIRFRWTVVSS